MDNKCQAGLFDPNGTRVETLEIDIADGKRAPSALPRRGRPFDFG